MIKLRLLAFLFVVLAVHPELRASPEFIIENPHEIKLDSSELLRKLRVAYELFEKEVGTLNDSIILSIAPQDCLRTSYQFVGRKIQFCSNKKVKNLGLDSVDVINHEVFHALLCHHSPHLCLVPIREDLHEGLADYFAYLLNPDTDFGEGFYRDSFSMRKYITSWRWGLVQRPHEKGNAYVAMFISSHARLKELLPLFDEAPPQDEFILGVEGASYSELNRYRLGPSDRLTFTFSFAPKAEVAKVSWILPRGLRAEELSPFSFTISLQGRIHNPKGMAVFYGRAGQELGRSIYYFGNKIE